MHSSRRLFGFGLYEYEGSTTRSFSLAYSLRLFAVGGDDGIRTHDPLLAGQVLSQLSYTPLLGVLATSSVTEN